MNTAVVIFSGYNQRAVIAFLRTLESTGTPYGIVASSDSDTIFRTDYKKNVCATRKTIALGLDDLLTAITAVKTKLGVERLVVAPSTEALNRFLIDHVTDLKSVDCEVPLVEKTLYEKISDKYAFGELCKEHGVLVPEEYVNQDSIILPCVAKPKVYKALDGTTPTPILLQAQEDVTAFMDRQDANDFYFQEFVEGDSLYLLYYFYNDGDVLRFSQQNLVQQPGGKSMVAAITSSFHTTEESTKYESLLLSLGFKGLIMVEVKHGAKGNYMIEANPRFWGPSQLFVDAGVNFFEAFLFDNGLIQTKPRFSDTQPARYFWYGGVVDMDRNDKLAYHSIAPSEFAEELTEWISADVYNRTDTRGLFVYESRL